MEQKLIPINEAIDSGAWLKVVCDITHDYRGDSETSLIEFRLRLRGFEKIDLSTGFTPESFQNIDSESNVWRLRMDIVNMHKKPLESTLFGDILDLTDSDGFIFARCKDTELTLSSAYADSSGLRNFFCSNLPPKIKKSGVFAYELPELFDDMYILPCYKGKITEA